MTVELIGFLVAGVDVDIPPKLGEPTLLDRFERGDFGEASCDPDAPVESFIAAFSTLEAFRMEPRLEVMWTHPQMSNDPGRAVVGVRIAGTDLISPDPLPAVTFQDVSEALCAAQESLQRVGCSAGPRLWLVFNARGM